MVPGGFLLIPITKDLWGTIRRPQQFCTFGLRVSLSPFAARGESLGHRRSINEYPAVLS
jgi:hypothetical protein